MVKSWCKMLLLLVPVAGPAAAQDARPGELAQAQTTAKEQVAAAADAAPWKLGPILLAPRLTISELGYVSNIYFSAEGEAQSDFRAQGSAGLRAFFNLGPKVQVSPFAGLDYAWWREQQDLRSLNESFGVQLFGDLNRLQLQLDAGRVGAQNNLSSEVEVPVNRTEDRLGLSFEVDFRGPFLLFGSVAESRQRLSADTVERQVAGLDLSTLESEGQRLLGGVKYELSSGLRIGLGIARTEIDYPEDPGGRSNRGSGPLFTLGFRGSRLRVDLDVARQELEFDSRRESGRRRQTDGTAQLGWSFTEKLSGSLYGDIQLTASALDSAAIYERRRWGIGLQRDPGRRAQMSVFFELGEDEFAAAADDRRIRTDDMRSLGVTLLLRMTPRLDVQFAYLDTRRDSTDPAFDRRQRSISSQVSLGGDLLPW